MTDLSMRVAAVAAPVRQQVAEVLRTAITSGRFAPGQRLEALGQRHGQPEIHAVATIA